MLSQQAVAQKPSDYIIFKHFGSSDKYMPPVIFYHDSNFRETDRHWQSELKDIIIWEVAINGYFYCLDTKLFNKVQDFIKLTKLDPENTTLETGLQTIIVSNKIDIYGEILYLKGNRESYCKGIISILKDSNINNAKIEAIGKGLGHLNYY